MKRIVLSLALTLGLVPLAVNAQGAPNGGPPPEMRAKMMQARGDAKTASYNALSADHRAKVQAIVDKFNDGTIADPRDAATQIDAVLTPDESKAALAQRDALHAAMRAAFAQNGAPGTQSGPASNGQSSAAGHGDHAEASAGRFLLAVAADPEKLHAAMRAERERSQQ